MLGHAEAAHLLRAEDLGHLFVGDEVLLVVGILEREGRKQLRSFTSKCHFELLNLT